MALNYINLQVEYFSDTNGKIVSNGFVYIGQPNLDPEIEANRVTVTLIQEDGTQVPILPASQPLRLGPGGRLSYLGSPVQATVASDYSIKVKDNLGNQVYFFSNLSNTHPASQITYDNTDSNLLAGNVKDALDELDAKTAIDIPYDNTDSGLPGTNVKAALDDLTDSNNIGYDNSTSGLTSATVQDAIDELTAKSNITATSQITFENGSFYIWQRGLNNTLLAANMNGADRWQLGEENTVGDTTMVMNQVSNPDITGIVQSKYVAHVEFQIITGGTDPFLGQRIYDPYFLSGQTITMSFLINNNSGSNVSCQSRIMPDGITGVSKATGSTFTIQSAAGYVLYTTTITIPTYQNANITGDSSNWIICPLHVPGIGASVDIEIADITINVAATPATFVPKTYSDELADCLAMYEFGGQSGSHGFSGSAAGGFTYFARTSFAGLKKVIPVMSLTHKSALAFNAAAGSSVSDKDGFRETRVANSSNDQAFFESTWIADSESLGTGI